MNTPQATQQELHEAITVAQSLVTGWLNDPIATQDTAPVAAISPFCMSIDTAARINAFIKHTPGIRFYAILDDHMVRIQEVLPVGNGEWVNCVPYYNKRDDARLCVRASSHFICQFALSR